MTESGTTELVTLPGLETLESAGSPERAHALQRGPEGKLMLFSGRSNVDLAERIAEKLTIELGDVHLKTFANGEVYCRFGESIRGADVFLVQSCAGPASNDGLMELLIMINAAKLASANRITAVMPWYPYSRQDKKSAPREPITAQLVAACLETAGVDRVLTMDLHAGQIQGFFTIPVDHMTALPLFAKYYRDRGLAGEGVIVVSPGPGPREDGDEVRRDARGRPDRPHEQGAPRARRRLGDRGRRRGRGQGRDPERRHHRHGRDADRGRERPQGERRDRGLRLRDARPLPGRRRSSGSSRASSRRSRSPTRSPTTRSHAPRSCAS